MPNRDTFEVYFPLAARTTTTNGSVVPWAAKEFCGVLLQLNITAVSGTTPTLDVKLQWQDPIDPAVFVDIPSAAFAQKVAAGTDALLVYPGTVEVANKKVSNVVGASWRVVATIGGTTPSFTFSLTQVPIP